MSRATAAIGPIWWGLAGLAAYVGLREATQGQLLISDDHPAFLYRLVQLREHFPWIPFYNPMWNGGVEAREFFPSGILNAFVLLLPLVAALDLTQWYNEAIAILFFVIHPACTALAASMLRIRAPLAPVIALFSSALWFRYQFIYGTVGFLTSVALSPLLLALMIRAASEGARVSWTGVLGILIVTSLFLLWSPAVFIALPAALVLLPGLIRFGLTRKGATLIVGLLSINLPWVLMFMESSRVSSFMTSPQSGEQAAIQYPSLGTLFEDARYAVRGAVPAIALLTIPGMLLLRSRHKRVFIVFGVTIATLFVAGLFAAPLKPRLELGRLMIVSLYLCAIPVACAVREAPRHGARRLVYALGVGSVLITPAIAYVFTANRTLEQYAAFSPELPGLVEAIKSHHEGGRIAFSGYVQHELDGGHITPLPLFTGVPLYASRYQHDRWEHTDFIPTQFRAYHDAGIEQFFDLFNITAIAVHDAEWRPWFSARPDYYTQVWAGSKFTLFRRRFGPRSWFLQGDGEILDQQGAGVRLKLNTPHAVIRFNWLPFLEVEGCGAIAPEEVFEGITFIRLEQCKVGEPIVVRAQSAVTRLLN
jgi:hypothetical protein